MPHLTGLIDFIATSGSLDMVLFQIVGLNNGSKASRACPGPIPLCVHGPWPQHLLQGQCPCSAAGEAGAWGDQSGGFGVPLDAELKNQEPLV